MMWCLFKYFKYKRKKISVFIIVRDFFSEWERHSNLVSIGEGNWQLVSCTISRENDCARPESQLRMWHYCQKKSVDSRHFKHTSKSMNLFLLLWSAMFFIKFVRPGLISFVDRKVHKRFLIEGKYYFILFVL